MSTIASTTSRAGTAARADLCLRTLAALIDVLVVGAMLFAFAATTGDVSSDDSGFTASLSGGAFLLFVAAMLAYYGVSERSPGARSARPSSACASSTSPTTRRPIRARS